MADLFKDIIPSIMETKKNVLVEEKDYVPFIVNKALSHHMDCILYANQLNMMHQVDRALQYQYALNTIRPYKRPFQKWQKRETIDDLEAVKEYFDFSYEKAKEALTVLTDSQLTEIKNLLDKGGVVNVNKSRRSHRSEVRSP